MAITDRLVERNMTRSRILPTNAPAEIDRWEDDGGPPASDPFEVARQIVDEGVGGLPDPERAPRKATTTARRMLEVIGRGHTREPWRDTA